MTDMLPLKDHSWFAIGENEHFLLRQKTRRGEKQYVVFCKRGKKFCVGICVKSRYSQSL